MADPLKIMCVHGLGDHRDGLWKIEWRKAIQAIFGRYEAEEPELVFVEYDPLFEEVELTAWETMQAVWKLARSAVGGAVLGRRGVIGDVSERVRWTAGYVVAWVEDGEFQERTRALVLERVAAEKPDLILAHSLGSLVTYNAFSHPDASRSGVKAALAAAGYVSLGSQIANPFVIGNLSNGRITPLPARRWHHLYNREDAVFTAPIRADLGANFAQVETPFDINGVADHSAVEYLRHANTVDRVWTPLIAGAMPGTRAPRRAGVRAKAPAKAAPRAGVAAARAKTAPARRALLVGINAYPNESDRLEGCVNDVYLMSSVLQECGFAPDDIRVCLDDRATAGGILERLDWLLDAAKPGDERVFFYSGHGARIPEYGENFEPDRQIETLVPWDFDWSRERAIVDDQIYSLYGQLPYECRFAMILDCCHSGGMHRQGGARVRGITPPDDIRHREIKWDQASDMWVPRDFTRINPDFSKRKEVNDAFFGENGATSRLGRAASLRRRSEAEYLREKRALRRAMARSRAKGAAAATTPSGPYLPLIIEACSEEEYSYEYRHGVASYGAFTFALSKRLRARGTIAFRDLVEQTRDELRELGYRQTPQILGPSEILASTVPWTS